MVIDSANKGNPPHSFEPGSWAEKADALHPKGWMFHSSISIILSFRAGQNGRLLIGLMNFETEYSKVNSFWMLFMSTKRPSSRSRPEELKKSRGVLGLVLIPRLRFCRQGLCPQSNMGTSSRFGTLSAERATVHTQKATLCVRSRGEVPGSHLVNGERAPGFCPPDTHLPHHLQRDYRRHLVEHIFSHIVPQWTAVSHIFVPI
jgi:hypothetical protein